jgi:hypothetical protein
MAAPTPRGCLRDVPSSSKGPPDVESGGPSVLALSFRMPCRARCIVSGWDGAPSSESPLPLPQLAAKQLWLRWASVLRVARCPAPTFLVMSKSEWREKSRAAEQSQQLVCGGRRAWMTSRRVGGLAQGVCWWCSCMAPSAGMQCHAGCGSGGAPAGPGGGRAQARTVALLDAPASCERGAGAGSGRGKLRWDDAAGSWLLRRCDGIVTQRSTQAAQKARRALTRTGTTRAARGPRPAR